MAPLLLPRPVKIPIRGRHVFITGGSSGIGLAMARLAAAEGARVSILARNARNLEAACDDIRRATGAEVAAYIADVRDEVAVGRAVEAAGPVDVLVCCHGVFPSQELAEQSMEEVKGVIDINLTGTFQLIKTALPGMKAGGDGRPRSIALVSSMAGQGGVHGFTAYCATKFALRGLAEALQQEIITDNIHVSLIFPPTVETPGLIEVNKTRTELSTIMASHGGNMEVNYIARKSIDGIKSGKFFISFGLQGAMLSLATAGLAPQRSLGMAILEVLLSGLTRIIGLFIIRGWYQTIEEWYAKQKQASRVCPRRLDPSPPPSPPLPSPLPAPPMRVVVAAGASCRSVPPSPSDRRVKRRVAVCGEAPLRFEAPELSKSSELSKSPPYPSSTHGAGALEVAAVSIFYPRRWSSLASSLLLKWPGFCSL